MNRFLKEPLLHFLTLGGLLFVAYSWLNRSTSGRAEHAAATVRVTTNDVAWLVETWGRQWQRAPTREELRGLVRDFLKEELLAREARAMGLDENDTIVRRRLAQKLEFLVQDTSHLADPTEDDLRRFYESNRERFETSARASFTQVFFNRELRKDAAADAKAALAQLRGSLTLTRPSELGDRLLLDSEFLDADKQTVASQFGNEFARALFSLRPGAWQGPIESAYGFHLVRVSEVKPSRLRGFGEVREQVLSRWRDQKLREDNEKYFAGLLKKYDVVVDETLKPLMGPLDGPLTAQVNASKEGRAR